MLILGEVWNTSVSRDVPIVSDDPNANFYRVDDMLTINTAISYTIENNTALDGTRLRFGINNLFDEYQFFHKYPDKELKISGLLFGNIIQHQLVVTTTLGVALR